jgi:hypothetical protein
MLIPITVCQYMATMLKTEHKGQDARYVYYL